MHRCQPCPLLKTAGSHRSHCPALPVIEFSHRHTLIIPSHHPAKQHITTLPIPPTPRDTFHAAPSQRLLHLTAPPRRPVHTSAATRDPCPQLDNGNLAVRARAGNLGVRACHMQAARHCSVAVLLSPASLDKARCGTTAYTRHAPAQQQLSRHCLP